MSLTLCATFDALNALKHQYFTQNLQLTEVLFIAPDPSRSLSVAPLCALIRNILHSNSHTRHRHTRPRHTLGFEFFFAHSVRLIRVVARHRHVNDRHLRRRLTFRHSSAPGRAPGDTLLHEIDIVSFEVVLHLGVEVGLGDLLHRQNGVTRIRNDLAFVAVRDVVLEPAADGAPFRTRTALLLAPHEAVDRVSRRMILVHLVQPRHDRSHRVLHSQRLGLTVVSRHLYALENAAPLAIVGRRRSTAFDIEAQRHETHALVEQETQGGVFATVTYLC